MTDSTPTQPTIIRLAIERALAELLCVGQPGRIETYDRARRCASVQPLIRNGRIDRATGVRVLDTQPVLPSVPVIMMGNARCGISIDVQPGDTVWLLGSRFALDTFGLQGTLVDPDDDRRNDPSDAVALVGLFSFGAAPEASDGGVVVHGDRVRLGGLDAADPVARKSDIDAIVAKLNALIGAVGSPVPPLLPLACSLTVSIK